MKEYPQCSSPLIKCRLHTGLKGLTPYKKLKELQGKIISKDFRVSNIYTPLDNIYVFCIE